MIWRGVGYSKASHEKRVDRLADRCISHNRLARRAHTRRDRRRLVRLMPLSVSRDSDAGSGTAATR
jgi:hypothetical protein